MSWRHTIVLALVLSLLAFGTASTLAQDPCPGNLVANASIEEGSRGTGALGTRPSSVVANAWIPWSVWGYSVHSREAEFEVEDITRLGRYSTYRVHSGQFSQKFSTTFGVHNAGFYQRIPVPQGSQVTFSMWVQIYTGQEQLTAGPNKEYISDLSSPGNYRVYVGIDAKGDVPPGFGAPPSEGTVWSQPVLDRETRRFDDAGVPYDAWVQIEVTAQAESDHITVYTRGEPEFPVRVNVSYWDDACLTAVAPTAAPTPTSEFTATPEPSPTSTSTPMPLPSATPTATEPPTPTLAPTETEAPTATPPPPPTETPLPPATATATSRPTPRPAAPTRDSTDNPLLLFVFGALWLAAAGFLGWSLWQKRQASTEKPQS